MAVRRVALFVGWVLVAAGLAFAYSDVVGWDRAGMRHVVWLPWPVYGPVTVAGVGLVIFGHSEAAKVKRQRAVRRIFH